MGALMNGGALFMVYNNLGFSEESCAVGVAESSQAQQVVGEAGDDVAQACSGCWNIREVQVG